MKRGILLTMAAALVLMGAGCMGNVATNTTTTPPRATEGKVIFSITDATTAIEGVSSVQLTVDKIEMHSATNGWAIVSNDTKTFDLLALKASGALAVAAQVNVAEGIYNQIRLHVKKVAVVKYGAEAEAKLPSNNLEVNGKFTVTHNATTSVMFDFLADVSLHVTGNGKFVFAPVVKTESRTNADVSVRSNGTVTVGGGSVESDTTAGMDLDGKMRDNFKIEVNGRLEINDDNTIELMGTSSVKVKTDTGVNVKADLY